MGKKSKRRKNKGQNNSSSCRSLHRGFSPDDIRRLCKRYGSIESLHVCAHCGKKEDFTNGGKLFSVCGRCGDVLYCSREFQIAHYGSHKEACRLSGNKGEGSRSSWQLSGKMIRFQQIYSPIVFEASMYEFQALLVSMDKRRMTPDLWVHISETYAVYVQLEENANAKKTLKPGYVISEGGIQLREIEGDNATQTTRAKILEKCGDVLNDGEYIQIAFVFTVKGHEGSSVSHLLWSPETELTTTRSNTVLQLRACTNAYRMLINDMATGKREDLLAAVREALEKV